LPCLRETKATLELPAIEEHRDKLAMLDLLDQRACKVARASKDPRDLLVQADSRELMVRLEVQVPTALLVPLVIPGPSDPKEGREMMEIAAPQDLL
jgi:hypothetical protein